MVEDGRRKGMDGEWRKMSEGKSRQSLNTSALRCVFAAVLLRNRPILQGTLGEMGQYCELYGVENALLP